MATLTPEQFSQLIEQHAKEIQQCIDRTLPIKAGAIAVAHFKENFQKGGFVNSGLQAWTPAKRLSSGKKGVAVNYKTLLIRRAQN